MNIIRDFKNKLLNRREIVLEAENHGNPGFKDSIKMVAEKFKAGEDVIAIKEVRSEFGENKFKISAFIYDSAGARARIEPKPKAKKAVAVEAAPASAAPAAGGKK